MDRAEHLQWCKDRAIEYVNVEDLPQAVASMASDMRKHPETENHPGIHLGTMLMLGGHMNTVAEAEKWINGFN